MVSFICLIGVGRMSRKILYGLSLGRLDKGETKKQGSTERSGVYGQNVPSLLSLHAAPSYPLRAEPRLSPPRAPRRVDR